MPNNNQLKTKMGYGYGSEFQLLRFMGRYRNAFELSLLKALGLAQCTKLNWLDHQFNPQDHHLDLGLSNADFLSQKHQEAWLSLWPTNDLNWDGVAKFSHNGKECLILLNAKAYAKDLSIQDKCASKDPLSLNQLKKAIQSVKDVYRITHISDWTKVGYPIASRLVFKKYLEDNNIPVFIVDVYFIKGYEYSYSKGLMDKPKSIKTEAEWLMLIKQKHSSMGINNTILETGSPRERLNQVFVVCG
ncbi:MAG: hypothetical protein WCI62_03135 [Erysipelotrichaceae bacterium]